MRVLGALLHRFRTATSKTETPPRSPIDLLAPYSMSGPAVLSKLDRLARAIVDRRVPGDFVECGVCNGGSAGVIGARLHGPGRHAWLYDSFQGLPAPAVDDRDGPLAPEYTGTLVGDVFKVREAMRLAGLREEEYTVCPGWFEDTFTGPGASTISFLHIDSDWYASVLLCLRTFYDRVGEGGVIVLDDFGHWEGCRAAFYDFVKEREIRPLLERFGHSQAYWVKGRTHNRDFKDKEPV